MQIYFSRGRKARAKLGDVPNSTWYDSINAGLMTPGVKLSAKVVAWPDHELEAIARARLAGADDAAIRELVAELMAARKQTSLVPNAK
jgi:prophage regulatory protein